MMLWGPNGASTTFLLSWGCGAEEGGQGAKQDGNKGKPQKRSIAHHPSQQDGGIWRHHGSTSDAPRLKLEACPPLVECLLPLLARPLRTLAMAKAMKAMKARKAAAAPKAMKA